MLKTEDVNVAEIAKYHKIRNPELFQSLPLLTPFHHYFSYITCCIFCLIFHFIAPSSSEAVDQGSTQEIIEISSVDVCI